MFFIAAGCKSKVLIIAIEFVSDPLAKTEKATCLLKDDAETQALLIEGQQVPGRRGDQMLEVVGLPIQDGANNSLYS